MTQELINWLITPRLIMNNKKELDNLTQATKIQTLTQYIITHPFC